MTFSLQKRRMPVRGGFELRRNHRKFQFRTARLRCGAKAACCGFTDCAQRKHGSAVTKPRLLENCF
jgi:hypothetical protein